MQQVEGVNAEQEMTYRGGLKAIGICRRNDERINVCERELAHEG
jgi:hypothetical protein